MRVLTLLAIAALTVSAQTPNPNCGPWVSQTNGTSLRVCTDSNNQRYCELKSGQKITRFECE